MRNEPDTKRVADTLLLLIFFSAGALQIGGFLALQDDFRWIQDAGLPPLVKVQYSSSDHHSITSNPPTPAHWIPSSRKRSIPVGNLVPLAQGSEESHSGCLPLQRLASKPLLNPHCAFSFLSSIMRYFTLDA
jgi:hypothetical protein